MNSERQCLLRPRPRPTLSISKDTTGMLRLSPRSVVLKQDAHAPLLFVPAATPVFEEVQLHARVSNLCNESFGSRNFNSFPESAEQSWADTLRVHTSSKDECQESVCDFVPAIELDDEDGRIPKALLFPMV
jgi:hypothetical protein